MGLSEEEAMETFKTVNIAMTNQGQWPMMREGVVNSPLIAAIWVSKSQGYGACSNNPRCTDGSAICIIHLEKRSPIGVAGPDDIW
jgi:hypothetical protein